MSSYTKASVTVDIAVLSIIRSKLSIVLIQRAQEPFKDMWALPGGFLLPDKDVDLESAALRELAEETNIRQAFIEQLKTYGDRGRDPRDRVVSVAYYAIISEDHISNLKLSADTDAKDVRWFEIENLPNLAFDHSKIVADAINRIRGKIDYSPLAFSFVPREFTWPQLQAVYECVLARKLNASNFRKKVNNQFELIELSDKQIKRNKRGPRANYFIYRQPRLQFL